MAKKEKKPPVEEESKSGREAEASAAPPKKGGKMKLIIIVVLALAIGVGGGIAAVKFMGGGSQPEASAENQAPAASGEAPEKPAAAGEHGGGAEDGLEGLEPAGPQNIEFKSFIVNLNDAGGKRFLKLVMSVDAETPELADEINKKMPQFRDLILLLLSSLSYDDIATMDGKVRLRNQMLNRINTHLTSGKVRNIYFSEFVVQ